MASISSPLFHRNGKHTWSLSLLTWQAYLVPFVIDMASILSPPYNCSYEIIKITKGMFHQFLELEFFAIRNKTLISVYFGYPGGFPGSNFLVPSRVVNVYKQCCYPVAI